MQLQYVIRKQVSRVYLQKDGTTSIGIVLKDGVKTGSRPVIKAIKKGSIAYRSHCVSAKDAIVSVCGQDARGMSRRDFKHLLREADDKIEIELEYQIREACLNRCGVYRMERIFMKLKKESESYGFVLRKCGIAHSVSTGYPVISDIREGSPADRDGRLKAGDRLLQIDDQNLEMLSLLQVANILQAKDEAMFTVEYKIALIENSQIRLGERTNLEINCPDADLGLVLGSSRSRMIIEEIHKGSLADRCGAFRVGDDIVAINDIDVPFLSTSKANNLLRTFRKEPGRLVLVANTERLARPTQNSHLPREKTTPLLNEMTAHSSPERDQQVPSNNQLLVPCNSPQSLFTENLEDNPHEAAESGYYYSQITTFVMLREIIQSIAELDRFASSLTSNNVTGSIDNINVEITSNQSSTLQRGMSHLKVLSAQIKNTVHSMAMHLVENVKMSSNRRSRKNAPSNDCLNDNPQHLNQDDVMQELMKNLVEIYTKKLISKQNLDILELKVNRINSNCRKCKKSCMLAAIITLKILMIVSLNRKTRDVFLHIKRLIDDILRILPCEDCQIGSESQTGSEISRTTHHSSSLNHLTANTPCTGHSLNGNTSSSTTPIRSDSHRITGGNGMDNLQALPSCSAQLLFSSRNRIQSQLPNDRSLINGTVSKSSSRENISKLSFKTKTSNATQSSSHENDGSSINATISKSSSREDISSLNFKTKTGHATQSRSHQRLYHRADDNISLNFATPTHELQNETEVTPVHNGSLGFVTPNHCAEQHGRNSVSDNSTQPSTRILNDTQNNSVYQAELLPCKDDLGNDLGKNGKNYTSNISKKIFREKGLLKAQNKNCKSVESIVDSQRKSLKQSKPKIQKHSSEPQFLSPGCQSTTDGVTNCVVKDTHFTEDVEISYNKRVMEGENDDTSKYWSPFQRSDYNDHPNMLDIPNWSAKSSHSMKQIDQVSNERTMQDRVDVTLKNEGKGFGLSVEFLGSTSEDSNPLPRITAISSQGAAHRVGILQKGDRIMAINSQNTTGMTIMEFELLKEEAFNADEVLLTVEFDIVLRDLQFGTFDVCVTKTSKTGLIYNEFKKGSPLVVKGIVKGSPAHRCGSLFPGDEVLSAKNIRQELYEVFKNTYERSEYVIIRVRRQTFKEILGDEIHLERAELSPFKTHELNSTSIHSNHGSNKMFLDQELTLYRDPTTKDFGFLIGQDQLTKTIYVTDIRPDGPADCSKVIRQNDIILQVNGVDLEEHKDGPVVSLFQPSGNRLELKTRRMLKYE